jgi:hypothetical protein
MNRPVMHPAFEPQGPVPPSNYWKTALRKLPELLLMELLPWARHRARQPITASQIISGVIYRMAFLPILVVLLVTGEVYLSTHPILIPQDRNPSSLGIYYQPVNLLSDDGVRCEAWLIPAIDAARVVALGEKVVGVKHPAIVLVHDFAHSRQQMLPLIKPLHQAGLVVMVVGLRGEGTVSPAGQTFGLTESFDVRAAVSVLRRRNYVDPTKVAVMGIGSGATAALLASRDDPSIDALVLEDPIKSCDDVLGRRLDLQHRWLSWLQPLCKWTFEIGYGVDAEDLDLERLKAPLAASGVLMLDTTSETGELRERTIAQVRAFLEHQMNMRVATVQ